MDGYYILIDARAQDVPQMHYQINVVGYMEFLASVFNGEEYEMANEEECKRLSTFLGERIESMKNQNKIIYFTEAMFSLEEAQNFCRVYMQDRFDGVKPRLAARSTFDLDRYVIGRIELTLETGMCVQDRLEIEFRDEGIVSLPALYRARMQYLTPLPGNFTKIDIDCNVPSIIFYLS
jgi:hypothetical protein